MSNIDTNLLFGIFLLLIIPIGYLFRPKRYRSGLARRFYLQLWAAFSGIYVLMFVNDALQTRPGIDLDFIYASLIAVCVARVAWGLVKFLRIKHSGDEQVTIGRYQVGLLHVLIVILSLGLILLLIVQALSGPLNWFAVLILLFCVPYLVYFQKLHRSSILLSNMGIQAGENYYRWSDILDYTVMDSSRLILRVRQSIPLWDIRALEFPVSQRKVVEKYLTEYVTGEHKLDGQPTFGTGSV